MVRFVGDGIEEVEVSNSNSRIKFPYNFLRSRTFFDRRINLFLFLSFFFYCCYALIDKGTDWQCAKTNEENSILDI